MFKSGLRVLHDPAPIEDVLDLQSRISRARCYGMGLVV